MQMTEFRERIQQYGTPGPDGKRHYPMIYARRDPDAWLAWLCYFERVGFKASVQEMTNGWDTGMMWVVPTLDPMDFDPSIVVTMEDMEAKRQELDPPEYDLERRKEFAQRMVAMVKAKLKTMPGSRPVDKRGEDLKQMRNAVLSAAGKSDDHRAERDRRIMEHAERKAAQIAKGEN